MHNFFMVLHQKEENELELLTLPRSEGMGVCVPGLEQGAGSSPLTVWVQKERENIIFVNIGAIEEIICHIMTWD